MSANESEVPPDTDAEADADQPERTLSPFYDVTTQGTQVRVRAGWADDNGQVAQLPVDLTVGLDQADQAHALALNWYVETVAAAVQTEAEAEPEDQEWGVDAEGEAE